LDQGHGNGFGLVQVDDDLEEEIELLEGEVSAIRLTNTLSL
jgi:hypothetical protein